MNFKSIQTKFLSDSGPPRSQWTVPSVLKMPIHNQDLRLSALWWHPKTLGDGLPAVIQNNSFEGGKKALFNPWAGKVWQQSAFHRAATLRLIPAVLRPLKTPYTCGLFWPETVSSLPMDQSIDVTIPVEKTMLAAFAGLWSPLRITCPNRVAPSWPEKWPFVIPHFLTPRGTHWVCSYGSYLVWSSQRHYEESWMDGRSPFIKGQPDSQKFSALPQSQKAAKWRTQRFSCSKLPWGQHNDSAS